MIQRQVLEKRINEKPICDIEKSTIIKDISTSVQASQDLSSSIDFKDLYQQELGINAELSQKIELLQQKIKLLQMENYQLRQNQKKYVQYQQSSLSITPSMKKSQRQLLFQEILSFKENLPNSMKFIQFEDLQNFDSQNLLVDQLIMSKKKFDNSSKTQENSFQNFENKKNSNLEDQNLIAVQSTTMKIINDESLIDCLALYGLSKQAIYDQQKEDYFFQGELTYCSKAPHQIIKHASRLMFPSKIRKSQIKVMKDQEAVQNAIGLIQEALKSQMKAFTLIFEPAILPFDKREDYKFESKMDNCEQIIDLVNRERRFYSICIAFDDFDFVESLKSQKQGNSEKEGNIIRVSRRVISIFTKYPFISFFQELLIHCLKESFEQRSNEMHKNLSALGNFDHSKTLSFIKSFYPNLKYKYKFNRKFQYKLNEIFQVNLMSPRLNRLQSLSLQLSRPLLKNYYSQIWAYPTLRLFTIDNFLDILTMILLEEKVIFVSSNEHILTSAVFLFTQVLLKPFNYPYPVVSIIPNQYDYFNAPFPIVYGCLNSKENLIKQKIPQIYKNIYVILSPCGIQILNHNKFSVKIQKNKSSKLREKLLSSFVKMENHEKQSFQQQNPSSRFNGIASFLGFNSLKLSPSQTLRESKFIFSNNNRQISRQIIQKVFQFLNDIKLKLPTREQVQQIRLNIEKQIKQGTLANESKNIDVDKQTLERIINKISKKTSDPFAKMFLQSQIVSIEILS